jgi:hypothetical protein
MTNTTDTSTTLPAVASNFLAQCKKCESERYHKVLAHKTPTSAQIQCEVCKKKSTFKLAKPAKPKKAKKKTSAKTPAGPTWASLKEEIGVDTVSPYKMSANFKAKTAIEHPKFGIGFITTALPQKIDVVFEAGPVSLVHNRSAS